MSVIDRIIEMGALEAWKQVPVLVKARLKEASAIQRSVTRVAKVLPKLSSGYGAVYWNPDEKSVWAVVGDSDTEQDIQRIHNALKSIAGVQNVRVESEYGPYKDPAWIRIKRASALTWLNTPYQLAGSLTGGPSPLSNSIVSGLLGSGAGYTVGTLAENLMPEGYLEEGRLRKNLALAGGAIGAAAHIPAGLANMAINQKATGNPDIRRSFMQGDDAQQMSPNELDWMHHYNGGQYKRSVDQALRLASKHLPDPDARFRQASELFVKNANDSGLYGTDEVPLRGIPVDAFNNAIWNDVHNGAHSSQSNIYGTRDPRGDNTDTMHTPPMHAAAAVGLVSGIQQMHGNPSLLSPKHFISGLAGAGVDMATARVAGGVLGALGGLTPTAQQQLQQMGLWSGMIRGVTSSVLGLH